MSQPASQTPNGGQQAPGEPRPANEASSTAQLEAEVRKLRTRLAALESELVEVQAKADASVAHWQERAYWLERWHLDLNAAMRRPGAPQALTMLRILRSAFRAVKRAKRRLRS